MFVNGHRKAMRLRMRSPWAQPSTNNSNNSKLERAKAIATIFSAVAIPVVLTVAGYFIQKQLAAEGLRKDYVSIATTILKEKADGQEPELRAWAVKVLDENAPIPFSGKAKEGLLTGAIITAGLPWQGPPEACRKPPKRRDVLARYKQLAEDSEKTDDPAFVKRLVDFANLVGKAEPDVLLERANLECMQSWASITEQTDIDFRTAIGARPSKVEVAEMRQRRAAAASAAQASGLQP